jgi:hypothetical protein
LDRVDFRVAEGSIMQPHILASCRIVMREVSAEHETRGGVRIAEVGYAAIVVGVREIICIEVGKRLSQAGLRNELLLFSARCSIELVD